MDFGKKAAIISADFAAQVVPPLVILVLYGVIDAANVTFGSHDPDDMAGPILSLLIAGATAEFKVEPAMRRWSDRMRAKFSPSSRSAPKPG
jgi:hypothetical protein